MTHTEAFIKEMKEKLEEKKTRLEKELSRFATKTGEGEYETQFEEIGTDTDENAKEVENYVDNKALEQTLEGQLQEVDAALLRIENGTYGMCEDTKGPISEDRLRALPEARICNI